MFRYHHRINYCHNWHYSGSTSRCHQRGCKHHPVLVGGRKQCDMSYKGCAIVYNSAQAHQHAEAEDIILVCHSDKQFFLHSRKLRNKCLTVQATPSSQSVGVPATHWPDALHVSAPLHAFPSSQSLLDRHATHISRFSEQKGVDPEQEGAVPAWHPSTASQISEPSQNKPLSQSK